MDLAATFSESGMANKFWGGVVNALLPGTPYNRHTGQYGQAALRNSLISGVVNQVNPIAGAITQAALNRTGAQQAWNAGLEGYGNIANQFADARSQVRGYEPSMDVSDVGQSIGGGQFAVSQPASPMGQMVGGPDMSAYDARMAEAMQGLSGRINAAFAGSQGGQYGSGAGGVSRGLAGSAGFRGGGNGAGAGTGYGVGVIQNDAWGEAARGFGVGATSAGTAGGYALADAMRQNRMNRV